MNKSIMVTVAALVSVLGLADPQTGKAVGVVSTNAVTVGSAARPAEAGAKVSRNDGKSVSQETKKTPEKAGGGNGAVSTNGVPKQVKVDGKPADVKPGDKPVSEQVKVDGKPADAKPGDKPVSEDDESIPENLVKASLRIRGFLDTLGVKYKYTPKNEDIRFTVRVDGKIGSFDVIIQCCKSAIDCRFLHPVRVEETRRDEMAMLLVRLNHESDECWYDMDFADGEIVVRSMLAPEVVLKGDSERFVQFLQTSIETMQEELNMVLKVALGYKTAEEAVKED